ncbi:protein CURLY FLAG LEAF 2-like [Primulina tabacum]|uniref:protein CURLY FLAG LEAF 2-like n=1 Tax=Primulina tabacum TaxID=48773 RepID=UPI003F5A4A6B
MIKIATPYMDTIAASLERSLQNCSLNDQQSSGGCGGQPHGSDSPGNPSSDTASALSNALELMSQASLPIHWEQCLDLMTGEIYFINWRTGMKATEDPRSTAEYVGGYYSEDDCCSYDSEGSSSPSRGQWSGDKQDYCCQENLVKENSSNIKSNTVLVVAGCKSCLMYYMVPKQLEICPKCYGELLHFDRSEKGSP